MKSLVPSLVLASLASLVLGAGCAVNATEDTSVEASAAELQARGDLKKDLAARGGWVGTPFAGRAGRDVARGLAGDFKALLDRCVVYRETENSLLPTDNRCTSELFEISRDEAKVRERATVRLPGNRLFTAVMWDNESSDGGDMQDLAVYEANGNRIGVYRGLFSRNDTVLDALAAAFTNDTRVEKIAGITWATTTLRGATQAIENVCEDFNQGECTFAASLYTPPEATWNTLVTDPAMVHLTDDAAVLAAMKECLFGTFAYTHYTPRQQATLAARTLVAVRAAAPGVGFFKTAHLWTRPGLDAYREDLIESASVGGPACSLVMYSEYGHALVDVASDVDD